jgi:hypothetical protein
MTFGLHEGFHYRKPIFKVAHLILLEQFGKLFLFLFVQCLKHMATLANQ